MLCWTSAGDQSRPGKVSHHRAASLASSPEMASQSANSAHLRFFGARTCLSASGLTAFRERTGMSNAARICSHKIRQT